MPTTNNRNLDLDRNGGSVTVRVTYNAVFSVFERRLAGLGMRFRERIAVIGVDPSGSTTGTVLASFPSPVLGVTDGATPQIIPRNASITVSRATLDEDGSPFFGPDVIEDQIRCRIRLEAIGLPPAVTPDAFTDQEVLGGGVLQPAVAAAGAQG